RAAAFGGDPHVHVAYLGDTTALAHAGTRRIVLGLSATACFPLAPHHHVHVEPRWWVRDATDTVEVVTGEVERENQEVVRISGLDDAKRADATRELAGLLWKPLQDELTKLRTNETTRDRARVLLATTSYASAQHLAEGLVAAGVAPHRICLGVRPKETEQTPAEIRHDDGTWRELPADRL